MAILGLALLMVGCAEEDPGSRYLSDAAFLRGLAASDLTPEYQRTYGILRNSPRIALTLAERLPPERLRELFVMLHDLSVEQLRHLPEAARIASERLDPADATDYVAVLGSYPIARVRDDLLRLAEDPGLTPLSRISAIHWLHNGEFWRPNDGSRSARSPDMDPCLQLYLLALDAMRGEGVGHVEAEARLIEGAGERCRKDFERMVGAIRERG